MKTLELVGPETAKLYKSKFDVILLLLAELLAEYLCMSDFGGGRQSSIENPCR